MNLSHLAHPTFFSPGNISLVPYILFQSMLKNSIDLDILMNDFHFYTQAPPPLMGAPPPPPPPPPPGPPPPSS